MIELPIWKDSPETPITAEQLNAYTEAINELNETLSKLPTPADYVIEQGTSGIWTYTKWNSGYVKCECVAEMPIPHDIVYKRHQVEVDVLYPFAIVKPKIHITNTQAQGGNLDSPYAYIKGDGSGFFVRAYVVYNDISENTYVSFNVEMSGYWKEV